ncbi:XkdX family protein [Bacillus subtilis]|uniref:XkdX family protein n=1 Tax=Bacillus subtilis TaxID=1423 RepID=UPI00100A0411|nr:XkdX family protein [Bacillus subtilis]WJD91260.1 XkdX family protein [Bacillus spizizenii]QAV85157.1 XkdX family protein [Bacillus subtilis]QAV86628.1 XkdX family protein [Bacillus subtilis]QPG33147.1 XkdX family protein [Bacillus subtilis]QTM25094.1 XkdX family protein [Bacillus subtilis]
MYNAIKLYYAKGYYDKQQVARFVELGKISREQYAAITGEVYSGTVPAEPTPEDPPTETPPSTEEPTNDGTDGGDTEPPSEGPSGATDGSTGTE